MSTGSGESVRPTAKSAVWRVTKVTAIWLLLDGSISLSIAFTLAVATISPLVVGVQLTVTVATAPTSKLPKVATTVPAE